MTEQTDPNDGFEKITITEWRGRKFVILYDNATPRYFKLRLSDDVQTVDIVDVTDLMEYVVVDMDRHGYPALWVSEPEEGPYVLIRTKNGHYLSIREQAIGVRVVLADGYETALKINEQHEQSQG